LVPDWLEQHPTARAVVLFSGLNLLMVLLASLTLVSDSAQGGRSPVLFQPLGVLVRVAVALALFGVLLYVLRPGRRSRLELSALVLLGAIVVALLTLYADPLLSLALVPFVARYWLSLRKTLLLATALFAWSMVWGLTVGHLSGMNPPLVTILVFAVLSVVFGGYALVGFEFAVREARAREQLGRLYGELAQSYEQLRSYRELEIQHAHLEERSRISRELHDTLGHDLTAQRFDLQVLKKVVPDDETAQSALARALGRNAEATANLKRAVRALRPERLEAVTLAEAIGHLVRVSADPERVCLSVEGEEGFLHPEARVTLYRTVQEVLTNATKHAPGERLEVHVRFLADHVELEACNSVAGSDYGAGFGLEGLRERIGALGGTFGTDHEGGRFRLWASLPR